MFAGRDAIFIPDLLYVLEKLWATLKELFANRAERVVAGTRLNSLIKDVKAKK